MQKPVKTVNALYQDLIRMTVKTKLCDIAKLLSDFLDTELNQEYEEHLLRRVEKIRNMLMEHNELNKIAGECLIYSDIVYIARTILASHIIENSQNKEAFISCKKTDDIVAKALLREMYLGN